jgi:ribosomal protein S18 acetylase RimI-like enzyme
MGQISLRPAHDDDDAFVFALFAQTRRAQFAALGWPSEQLDVLLHQQYDFRRRGYGESYPDAADRVIEIGPEAVGRLLTARLEGRITIIDIAVADRCRGTGIGGAVLALVQGEAAALGADVILQVDVDNPAQRLYTRLGFEVAADHGLYREMRWSSRVLSPAGTMR